MRLQRRPTVPLLAAALAIGGVSGCDEVAGVAGRKAKQEAEKAVALAVDPPKPAGPHVFIDVSGLPGKLAQKIPGPTRILELTIHPQFAKVQVQNPAKKLKVDEYELRNGAVDDGRPVEFLGSQPTEKDLAEATFPLEEVDFSQVPRMLWDAPVQLGVDGGKVTHLILKRPLPYEKEVRWRVNVSSDRRDGAVEYDVRGVMKKVWQ
jgi:hypothetical protein